MKKALYVGSFDPPTCGHEWMIIESSHLFDEVIVAPATNPNKKPLFNIVKRLWLLQEIAEDLNNVTVKEMPNVFHIDFAADNNCDYLIRGIRNPIDLEQETQIIRFNEQKNCGILPVFLMPPKNYSDLSSSLIKSFIGIDGWTKEAAHRVPFRTLEALIDNQMPRISAPIASSEKSIINQFIKDFN